MLEQIAAGGDFGSAREWRRERTLAEGKGRFQLRGFGRPYPWYRAEFIDTAARQPAKTPEAVEDFETDLNRGGSLTTDSKEDRQQLRIGQCISSLCEEAFAGSFSFRPVRDA
jgi:hypothetical protein